MRDTVQKGEYVQTMGRQAVTAVFAEVIAIWAVGQPEIVKRVHRR